MSITLQCVVCNQNVITLRQPGGGIRPWVALCVECWETAKSLYKMAKPE